MHELTLCAHPQTPEPAIYDARVHVSNIAGQQLRLEYSINGDITRLALPVATATARRDELWKHTCAEAFIAIARQSDYCEFNFSPSTEWAAYRFDAYRHGMHALASAAPVMHCERTPKIFVMKVELTLPQHLCKSDAVLNLGLSMVIERADGARSYWALSHAGPQPDFHRRESFILTL